MKFNDEYTLKDWSVGENLIWFEAWNYKQSIFGIYRIETTNSKIDGDKNNTHVFGKVVSVVYESPKMFEHKIGTSTPGIWPESFSKDLNMLGSKSGKSIIEMIFS